MPAKKKNLLQFKYLDFQETEHVGNVPVTQLHMHTELGHMMDFGAALTVFFSDVFLFKRDIKS